MPGGRSCDLDIPRSTASPWPWECPLACAPMPCLCRIRAGISVGLGTTERGEGWLGCAGGAGRAGTGRLEGHFSLWCTHLWVHYCVCRGQGVQGLIIGAPSPLQKDPRTASRGTQDTPLPVIPSVGTPLQVTPSLYPQEPPPQARVPLLQASCALLPCPGRMANLAMSLASIYTFHWPPPCPAVTASPLSW